MKDFVKYDLEHQWKDVKPRLRPLLKKTHLKFQENHFETSVDQKYHRSTGDKLATLIWGRSLTRRWIEEPGKMSGCFFWLQNDIYAHIGLSISLLPISEYMQVSHYSWSGRILPQLSSSYPIYPGV